MMRWAAWCRWLILAAACLLVAQLRAAGEENLLANPSFEQVGNDGVPVGWQREWNPVLGAPLLVVEDAHDGKRAACLLTEEWNYHRPQFLTQTVRLPKGTKAIRLAAWCKGQGMATLAFRFLKGSEPHQTRKLDLGFGPVVLPVEVLESFSLGQTYELCDAVVDVPDGADGVMVKLGNTVGPLNRLNVWGKAWIDSASLTTSAAAPPVAAPDEELPEKITLPSGCRDVAPLARVVMQPPSFEPQRLFDGDIETAASFMGGVGRAPTVSFVFAKPVPVHSVNLHVGKGPKTVRVRGDADGDGVYETVLGRARWGEVEGWLSVPLEPTPVQAVRLQPLEGAICGYRQAPAFAHEVQVLVASQDAGKACPGNWGSFRRYGRPRRGQPELELRPATVALPEMKKSRFRRLVCADLWMWGLNGAYKKDAEAEGCTDNPTFRSTLEMVKRMGVEGILIDLHVSSGRNLMPWPSKVCNGTQENFLRPVIDALHAEGFEVFFELLHNITPFETVKWHYPQEETSRYPGMKQYPSIVHGEHFKKNWLTIADEIMACGADGLGISFDEHYYKGHFMETFPKDDPARALYRKRFGRDLPAHEADTLAFRQWIAMRHEGVADLFGHWTSELRKKQPGIYTSTMFMYPTAGYSYVTENGVVLDLIGARSGISEVGSDYQGPYGIRLSSAVNGWRKGTMLHNGDMWPYPPLPDLHFYETALWNLMYGAGSVNYWRLNYVVNYGHAAALTRAYAMVRDLDALGLWDARPPKAVALLSSRASIDWWQIRAWWGRHDDPNWDRGLEGQRSWFADQAAFNILQRNGVPFDWFFLDHPEQLRDLEQYRVLVVPFAYSIGAEAAARVKAAAAKGAKVILLDGRLGPTDEWGEPHPQPIFKDLVDAGQAVVFDDDILAWGASDALADKVVGAIDAQLGEAHPFKLHRYGLKVDATLLERETGERFVFLINHAKRPAVVDLEMALPDGRYEVIARDENRWHRVSLGGKAVLDAKDLRKCRLMLAREQPYVLVIQQAK